MSARSLSQSCNEIQIDYANPDIDSQTGIESLTKLHIAFMIVKSKRLSTVDFVLTSFKFVIICLTAEKNLL